MRQKISRCALLICVPFRVAATGKEIEFDIEPTDTVKRIKERVEEKEGIPPPQQVPLLCSLCPDTEFRGCRFYP